MDTCSKPMQQESPSRSPTSTPPACSRFSSSASSTPAPPNAASSALPRSGACGTPPPQTPAPPPGAGASLLGGDLDGDESLGGDGTPAVSAFAPEPLAATLGVATQTAMKLIADALDLQHRLPRIWGLVERLEVEPYKARHVAQATHALSKAAAGVRRRAARRPAALVLLAGDRDRGRPRHREVPPRAPRPTREAGQAVLARHPAPPRPERVRGDLLARHHRRHPRPHRLPRPRPRPRRRS